LAPGDSYFPKFSESNWPSPVIGGGAFLFGKVSKARENAVAAPAGDAPGLQRRPSVKNQKPNISSNVLEEVLRGLARILRQCAINHLHYFA
jgi:hypothetical protein